MQIHEAYNQYTISFPLIPRFSRSNRMYLIHHLYTWSYPFLALWQAGLGLFSILIDSDVFDISLSIKLII